MSEIQVCYCAILYVSTLFLLICRQKFTLFIDRPSYTPKQSVNRVSTAEPLHSKHIELSRLNNSDRLHIAYSGFAVGTLLTLHYRVYIFVIGKASHGSFYKRQTIWHILDILGYPTGYKLKLCHKRISNATSCQILNPVQPVAIIVQHRNRSPYHQAIRNCLQVNVFRGTGMCNPWLRNTQRPSSVLIGVVYYPYYDNMYLQGIGFKAVYSLIS